MSSTAIICSFVPGPSAQASVSPWKTVGRQEVLHEEHRTQNHVRREPEAAHGFLDASFVVEVRDAVRWCADPTDV
jgi:hypothetical protein